MFKINLSPQFSYTTLSIKKAGNSLTINGTPYDFSSLNDGDEIPADAISDPSIVGKITKDNGIIKITILMPYSDPDAEESVLFPEPIILDEDGEVSFND